MNSVEKASRDILIALVTEASQGGASIPDLKDLKDWYSLKIADVLLPSSIDRWSEQGLLIESRTYDGTAACIKPGKYGQALQELLDLLECSTFEINWAKEEILTDAAVGEGFPSRQGWKIYQFENGRSEDRSTHSASVSSSAWTGVTSEFKLSEKNRNALVRALDVAERDLHLISASQEVRAQAKAYIIAMKTLAEAPDPPTDLIWEMVQRANGIAGVASLLVSIISLFVK